MDWSWSDGGAEFTVRELAASLPEYAYTTLATVLDRLALKGVLRSRRVGRTKRYATVGNKGGHTAILMYDALSSDADPAVALRRFVESLNESEKDVLRDALDEARVKRD